MRRAARAGGGLIGVQVPAPDHDAAARRLTALAESIRTRFGDDVVAEDGVVLRLRAPEGACPVTWFSGRGEIVLGVGAGGCRWELARDDAGATFVEDVVEAVVGGHVMEVLGPGRAAVAVTLADGRVERTAVRDAPRGCLPVRLPRRRSGPLRHVAYEPYR